MAGLLTTAWNSLTGPVDAMVPVPLHSSRERERGYNQSLLLARQVQRWANVPVASNLVVRTRRTVPQVSLHAQERQRNVAQAFGLANQAGSAGVVGRHFVLIDDVCTTGATLAACAAVLQTAGAAAVWAVTIARAGWTRHSSGRSSPTIKSESQSRAADSAHSLSPEGDRLWNCSLPVRTSK
ncbi:MAG: ComF family protein [Anaerolineae bacterium]|nr:MAG: ComF family protein [Anaerolineae bacterium]